MGPGGFNWILVKFPDLWTNVGEYGIHKTLWAIHKAL